MLGSSDTSHRLVGPDLESGWPLCLVLYGTIPSNLQNEGGFSKATNPLQTTL